MKFKLYKLYILLLLVVAGCSHNERLIYDLERYSQNPYDYVDSLKIDTPLCSAETQSKLDSLSLVRYYSCWSDSLLSDTTSTRKLLEYYQNQVLSLKRYPGYGENKLLRDSTFYDFMQERVNLDGGFNTLAKGIMLQKANIRVLPSNKPYFRNFELAGEGYPFDYWQNSTIPMATPVFIYHEIDNWYLIASHLCSGWIEKDKIAFISNEVISKIKKENRVAIVQDRTPIYSKTGEYLGNADIGTFFSYLFTTEKEHKAIFVKRNEWGYTETVTINIPLSNAERMPLPLTQNNLAMIAERMMNQVYGWGGMYFNRDCSQLTLDLFTPFGHILPRNGNHQASHGGEFISIFEVKPKEYKQFIIENSTPFITLIRVPGHIMVYLGEVDGNPLVLHNIWGLRTVSLWGKEGREVIGKTVITSLELGRGFKGVKKKRLLLKRVSGVVNLFEISQPQQNNN